MRLNENTKIIGNNVILIPYKEKHVPKCFDYATSEAEMFPKQIHTKKLIDWPCSNLYKELFERSFVQKGHPAIMNTGKYHTWMLSEELRNLTASEKLSLEEEYNMQKSWLLDENKCTFIILDKEIHFNSKNEIASMIGDTNFFFKKPNGKLCAEAEIMIAEVSSRGKKRGWEAMLHMILYGIVFIQIEEFVVKIGGANSSSINMFQRMGFLQTKPVDIFNEISMERNVDSDWVDWIRSQLPTHEISKYETNV